MTPDSGKEEQPDFGTYHHSTAGESTELRKDIKVLFTEAFAELPFSRDGKLKILDVGCGLGFLSCFCAEFYPNATVTGFDTFGHESLKDSSLGKARDNASILGLSHRVDFGRGDVFRADYSKKDFDLIVSNLVFHNFGRKRLVAYERLARWAKPKSYVVLGDLFFDYETDLKRLSNFFASVKERPPSRDDTPYKVLVMSSPVKKAQPRLRKH
jgi:SAM-dependent methyltransferase